jgi:hypothetical protein
MALARGDVTLDQIHDAKPSGEPEYSSDDCHSLVLWAWSRTAEDIEWEDESLVYRAARWLGERYVEDPPLIQAANAHFKVARIAAAMAAATFSADSSGRRLIIRESHVRDATRLLDTFYGRDTFGYRRMSERLREHIARGVDYWNEARRYLLDNPLLLRFLLACGGEFRRDMVEQTLNVRREEANAIVNKLYQWGLVAPNTQAIKIMPILHQILREVEES